MRLRKLGAALVIAAALGAVLASSAFAAAVTEDVKWYTGTAPGTELTGSETIGVSQVGEATFKTHVAGETFELHWTGIECVECSIKNTEGVAVSSGRLRFTGVSEALPVGCTVPTTITSKPVTGNPGWMSGATDYIRIVPTFGEEETFFGEEFSGCPLERILNVKGNIFFKYVVTTGTQAVEQSWNSSEGINSEAGGSLHVGTEAAALTMGGKFKLTGTKAGTAFGTH